MSKHLGLGRLLEVQVLKKCAPLWREAHFELKMYKTPQHRTTFGSSDAEKEHAVVARSTFPSKNVQKSWGSDHFVTIRWSVGVEKVHAVGSQMCEKVRALSDF